ncbi:MAG: septum formation initiator family protein [Deltaproteobacteria bacterium]|nr:septum formation initiator family protein [Deltaproteobacteria bacterium]
MNGTKKIFVPVIICLLLALILAAIFGSNGLLELNLLKQERDTIIKNNNTIQNRNLALYRKIERLKYDKEYIESVARRELGLIGKDDIILKFKP